MKTQRFGLLTALGLLLVPALLVTAGEVAQRPLAEITASSGDTPRFNTPVCVELPDSINAWRPLRLVEAKDDKLIPVPTQVEPGDPEKLWWILAGDTPPDTTRTYQLLQAFPVKASGVNLTFTAETLNVSMNGAKLFTYHHGFVFPPKGVDPAFIRSGYIHPLFSPSGKLVTEDFPGDHYHHKGIWFPWTHTKFEGREVDFWNLAKKQGTVQFAGFDSVENGPVYGRVKVDHEFVDLKQPDGGKIVLDETWDMRIWAVGGREAGYWIFDITSTQECVADTPLHLKAHRYGGMGFRGAKEWIGDNYELLSSEGHTKKNGHTKRSKWCAHSGAVDGKWATVVIMCHPKNTRFPEPMRIWDKGGAFFNYVPIQKKPMDLKPGEQHTFSYRFFVHDGKINKEKAEKVWRNFADPPSADLKPVK